MVSQQPSDSTTNLWCLGWPLQARKPLAAEEFHVLRGERIRNILLGWLLVLLFPFFFFGGLTFLAAPDLLPLPFQIVLFTWGVPIIFLALSVVSAVLAKNCFRRARIAGGDIRAGEKFYFTGLLTEEMCCDQVVGILIKSGELQASAETSQYVVLLASGRLWVINNQRASSWTSLPITQTAAVPEYAHIAAEWLEPVAKVDENTYLGGQRELSADELKELRRLARRCWLPALLPAIPFTVWCGSLLVSCLVLRESPPANVFFYLLIALTILADFMLIKGISMAARLYRDLSIGRVDIIQGPTVLKKDFNIVDGGTVHTFEILPVSHIAWTLDGVPTAWRRFNPRW